MTDMEIAYLILSVAVFVTFGVVLYAVERYCRIGPEAPAIKKGTLRGPSAPALPVP